MYREETSNMPERESFPLYKTFLRKSLTQINPFFWKIGKGIILKAWYKIQFDSVRFKQVESFML